MWNICFFGSLAVILLSVVMFAVIRKSDLEIKWAVSLFNTTFVGVIIAVALLFLPVYGSQNGSSLSGITQTVFLTVLSVMQVFTTGCDFGVVEEAASQCPGWIGEVYPAWGALLFVLAPVFTFGFVLSFFKNLSAYAKFLRAWFDPVYIFTELNEKSLALADDIRQKLEKVTIVFTDVFDDGGERLFELMDNAEKIGAICFKKDIASLALELHSASSQMHLFVIGTDETENLNQSLKLIERLRNRMDTHLYVFSTKVESEILLTAVDKGKIKVRRINEVQSLVNRVLYERGEIIFDSARQRPDGSKHICAVIVGMGHHGNEMVKALSWFGQMDGYTLEIHAFDADPLAEEKFVAKAPELMAPEYNGVTIDGEAQYKICIHSGIDVATASFVRELQKLKDTTYVMVALGDDDININTAVDMRMRFERMKIHPVIQTIVYNSQQKKALQGIRNYRGQEYDIEFLGDLESSYSEAVILDSELEEDALQRHLKWGKEEEFWNYEYNYRSSMASAIHMRARIHCGIPGARKAESELTPEEERIIGVLEHRRWNAYMRSEGYVYSGSPEKASRNDLAKMHHDLVDYSMLSEEEKRKDSKVGTK